MGFLSLLSGRAWAVLGVVGVVAFLAWRWDSAAFDRGVASCNARHAKDLAAHIERAQTEARAIALQDAEISLAGETERERIRTIYRVLEKEVEKHVPPDCNKCRLSTIGIGMLNRALSGAKPETSDSTKRPDQSPPAESDSGERGSSGNNGIIDIRQRKVL